MLGSALHDRLLFSVFLETVAIRRGEGVPWAEKTKLWELRGGVVTGLLTIGAESRRSNPASSKAFVCMIRENTVMLIRGTSFFIW